MDDDPQMEKADVESAQKESIMPEFKADTKCTNFLDSIFIRNGMAIPVRVKFELSKWNHSADEFEECTVFGCTSFGQDINLSPSEKLEMEDQILIHAKSEGATPLYGGISPTFQLPKLGPYGPHIYTNHLKVTRNNRELHIQFTRQLTDYEIDLLKSKNLVLVIGKGGELSIYPRMAG